MLGGLCPNSLQKDAKCYDYYEYTKMVADAGGWPYFDILAFHPYRSPSPPEKVLPRSAFNVVTLAYNGNQAYEYNLMDEINQFRPLMDHWGQKPLWITVLGYSTYMLEDRAKERAAACTGRRCCLVGEKTDSETVQADYLVRSYIQALAAGVENILWYDFRDDNVVNDQNESSLGIIRSSYYEKKSYHAFGVMSRLLDGSQFVAQVRGQDDRWTSGEDIHEYRFQKGDQVIIALWKSRGGDECRTVTVSDIPTASVTQYGPNFSSAAPIPTQEIAVTGGTIDIQLTERPVFLVYEGGGQVLGSQATPSATAAFSTVSPWSIPTPPPNLTNQIDGFFQDPLGWIVKKLGLPTEKDLNDYLIKIIQLALIKLSASIENSFNQCLGGLMIVGLGLVYAQRRKQHIDR